jgi:hypothetical protein
MDQGILVQGTDIGERERVERAEHRQTREQRVGDRERGKQRERETEREGNRERQRQREREKDGDRETERGRQREGERQRERDRDRDREERRHSLSEVFKDLHPLDGSPLICSRE